MGRSDSVAGCVRPRSSAASAGPRFESCWSPPRANHTESVTCRRTVNALHRDHRISLRQSTRGDREEVARLEARGLSAVTASSFLLRQRNVRISTGSRVRRASWGRGITTILGKRPSWTRSIEVVSGFRSARIVPAVFIRASASITLPMRASIHGDEMVRRRARLQYSAFRQTRSFRLHTSLADDILPGTRGRCPTPSQASFARDGWDGSIHFVS